MESAVTTIGRVLALVVALGAAAGCRTAVRHPDAGASPGSAGVGDIGGGGGGASGGGGAVPVAARLPAAGVTGGGGGGRRRCRRDRAASRSRRRRSVPLRSGAPAPGGGGQLACTLGGDGTAWCWGGGLRRLTAWRSRAGGTRGDRPRSRGGQICLLKE